MNLKYDWNTQEIYESAEAWNKDFDTVKSGADFSEFKGKLGDAEQFLLCMKKQKKFGRILEKLSVYAMMKHDENTKDSLADSLYSRVSSLASDFSAAAAFIVPELTALPEETLKSYIANEKLSAYDYSLKCILKSKQHVLSENEEKILAMAGETFGSFRDIFTKTDNADLNAGSIKKDGKNVKLTHGMYGVLMQDKDRDIRQKTFRKYYKAYTSLINTISATYYGSVKKDVLVAKVKKYPSALAMALDSEDVDVKVYENLISSVHRALPLLHRYMAEKKKLLGYDEMHMYDMYVPATEGKDIKLPYEKAYDLVIEGLSVFGEEYANLLKRAREERWIDVYEKDGKKSGAYSVAVYDTHPYVLLNYQQTTHEIFTIAHEMGHSIHSYFSNKNQPYDKADYKIFVAEVASTVNEVLLVKYLLKKEKDVKTRKFLLSYFLEMLRTTLFRQTQFAEFEEFSHSSVEKGEPLTKESMCAEYLRLNKEYYGDAVVSDDEIKYEWARIPHFYRAFYVYKYATGIISATAIVRRILTEGEPAVKDYFKFLSSGNSAGPVELLKIAGADLTTDEPFNAAFKEFEDALDEFCKL